MTRERSKFWGVALAIGFVSLTSACASSETRVVSARDLSPSARAQRVYEQLQARTPPEDWSGGQASAFPRAPEGTVRPLERLAKSTTPVEEAAALKELGEALESTGYYSRVYFESLPNGATIKYRPIARKRETTVHVGWNLIAIGFYYVWAERLGKRTSPVGDQYDIIDKQVRIVVRQGEP